MELLAGRWPQEFLVKLTQVSPDEMCEQIKDNHASMVVIDLATVDLQKPINFSVYLPVNNQVYESSIYNSLNKWMRAFNASSHNRRGVLSRCGFNWD